MTTTETRTSFLGLTVEGQIRPGHELPPQKDITDLAPLLQALLDDATIVAFGWTQYTPYFNDGEQCIFSAGPLWVRTDVDPDPGDDDSEIGFWNLDVTSHRSLGSRERRYNHTTRDYDYGPYEGPDEARYLRCAAAAAAIASGTYDMALLAKFGDHADITITRDGITVTEYDHS